MHRDPAESVPEFEEIASVAMAVQNMWLTCTELGLGCYWSSPKAALEASEFLQLQANEFAWVCFTWGWHEMPEIAGKRSGGRKNPLALTSISLFKFKVKTR
ncbi:MAG: nitroreductase family protein [Lewinellaceae bacterium]|nr:nitroreductase family protein [Lewinellaceae bacterium]